MSRPAQIRDKTRHQLRATEALATHDRVQDMLNAVGLEGLGTRLPQLKTGALLQASVMMGARCGAPSLAVQAALRDYPHTVALEVEVGPRRLRHVWRVAGGLGRWCGPEPGSARTVSDMSGELRAGRRRVSRRLGGPGGPGTAAPRGSPRSRAS